MTLHISEFEGGQALSAFRVQQLLPRLQAVHERILGLSARFIHLAAWEQAPDASARERLAALLTYGDPAEPLARAKDESGEVVLVTPRLGTVSP